MGPCFLRASLLLPLLYCCTLLLNAWHHLVCSRSFSSEPPEWTCCLHSMFHDLCVLGSGGCKPFSYGSSAPPTAIPLHSSCCGTLGIICSAPGLSLLSRRSGHVVCMACFTNCLLGLGGGKHFSYGLVCSSHCHTTAQQLLSNA